MNFSHVYNGIVTFRNESIQWNINYLLVGLLLVAHLGKKSQVFDQLWQKCVYWLWVMSYDNGVYRNERILPFVVNDFNLYLVNWWTQLSANNKRQRHRMP